MNETPFDSVLKRMAIERADGRVYIKGAVESVVPLCGEGATGALAANTQMAARGLRVLAVATATPEGAQALSGQLALTGFGLVSAAAVMLAFCPPAGYVAWVRSRAPRAA